MSAHCFTMFMLSLDAVYRLTVTGGEMLCVCVLVLFIF